GRLHVRPQGGARDAARALGVRLSGRAGAYTGADDAGRLGMSERALGPYRLVSQLAVGGMAEIYVAKTTGVGGFEKLVALKVIHPNYSSDPEFVQMLVDEAKLAVQLAHANIVQTF